VIVESFERIYRSSLVGIDVRPLQFIEGASCHRLKLTIQRTADKAAYYRNRGTCIPKR
jgi:aconitase A